MEPFTIWGEGEEVGGRGRRWEEVGEEGGKYMYGKVKEVKEERKGGGGGREWGRGRKGA